MKLKRNIIQRLKSLKFNLDDLNECYKNFKKDTILECGLEYNKKYLYNENTKGIIKKADDLKKLRTDKLFTCILNFSQTYYNLKEYFKKEYSSKKDIIENFFSDEKIDNIARKDFANDLKHNPEKDLKFKLGIVSKEIINEPNKCIENIKLRNSWFYYDFDSVEYCNTLYNELMEFIKKEFK